MEPVTVRCSHILQKSTKSRRPFDSYRNKPVTRSPEEALENIKKIREEVVSKKGCYPNQIKQKNNFLS